MKTRTLALAGLILMMSSLLPAGQRTLLEGIMIRVNEEILTVSEFKDRLKQELAQISPKPEGNDLEQFARTLLENSANEMILLERAKEKGVTADEDSINKAVENLRKENGLEDDAKFEAALKESGLTLESLKKRYRRSFLMSRAAQSEIKPAEITREELRQIYNKNKEKYAVPAKIHLEQIIFPAQKDNSDLAAVQKRAEALMKRVQNGADLQAELTLAGVKLQDLGEIPKDDLRPELVKMLDQLPLNTFSDPLASPGGIQFLRVIKRIPAGYQSFESVEENLRRQESERLFREQQRGLIDKLKKDYLVDIRSEYLPGIVAGLKSHD